MSKMDKIIDEVVRNKVKDFNIEPVEVFSEVGNYIKNNLKTDLELKEVDISSNDFINKYTKNIFVLQSDNLEIILFINKENKIKLGVNLGLIDKEYFNTINDVINEFQELYLKFNKDNINVNLEVDKDNLDDLLDDIINIVKFSLGKGE